MIGPRRPSDQKELLSKIALFCDVPEEYVIPAQTVASIYEVPLNLQKYNITELIANKLNLGNLKPNLDEWLVVNKKIKSKKAR